MFLDIKINVIRFVKFKSEHYHTTKSLRTDKSGQAATDMSCIMRNAHGDCAADQRLCFRYIESMIPLLPKSHFQATSQLHEDRFSHDLAQIKATLETQLLAVKCHFV